MSTGPRTNFIKDDISMQNNKNEALGFFSSSIQLQPILSPIKIRFYAGWYQIEKFAPRFEAWLKTIDNLEVLPSIEVDMFYRLQDEDVALPRCDIAVLFMTEMLTDREPMLQQFTRQTGLVRAKADKTFVIN